MKFSISILLLIIYTVGFTDSGYYKQYKAILGKGDFLYSGVSPDKKYLFKVFTYRVEVFDKRKNFYIKSFYSEVKIKEISYANEKVIIQLVVPVYVEWDLLGDKIQENQGEKHEKSLQNINKNENISREYTLLGISEKFLAMGENGVVFLKDDVILGNIVFKEKTFQKIKIIGYSIKNDTIFFNNKPVLTFKPLLLQNMKVIDIWNDGLECSDGFLEFIPSLKQVIELMALSHWEKSEDKMSLKTLLDFYPSESSLYFRLAKLYLNTKEYTLAENYLKKALQLSPNDSIYNETLGTLYFFQEKYGEASKILKQSKSVNSYFYQGNIALIKKDFPAAIKFFEEVIKKDPQYYKAYNNLAVVYKKKKDFKRAEKTLVSGIKKNTNNADLYYNLGLLYQDNDNLIISMVLYEKVLGLNPEFSEAVNQLYYIYMKLDLEEKSLELLKKFLQNHSEDATSHYNIALLYKKKNNLPLAVFHFRAFLSFSNDKYLKNKVEKEIEDLLKRIPEKK